MKSDAICMAKSLLMYIEYVALCSLSTLQNNSYCPPLRSVFTTWAVYSIATANVFFIHVPLFSTHLYLWIAYNYLLGMFNCTFDPNETPYARTFFLFSLISAGSHVRAKEKRWQDYSIRHFFHPNPNEE